MTPADHRARDLAPFAASLRWRGGVAEVSQRAVPEESAVAIVHDATTTAVMMATPADLEDLAIGFSLTEGLIDSLAEITGIEVVDAPDGIEARVWLAAPRSAELAARRRRLAGPTGCGLCGVDSLAEANRTPKTVSEGLFVTPDDIGAALRTLPAHQALGDLTRAVHAAAWWTPGVGLVALKEDVGRHNALDKLVGMMARTGVDPTTGFLLLTSRVSVEMVQKAAVLGAQVMVAVSAPTALAIRTAKAAGITLVAVARDDGFEVFNRAERISA